MSLQEDCWQEHIPAETARIGQILMRESDLYRQVGDHVGEILTLEEFAPLYSEEGRGAICPIVLSLVVLFQYLEKLPDREAAAAVVVRMDWKYALHVPLEWQGFHYSTLSYFRQRLLEHGAERLLFDKILAWIISEGYSRKLQKQRTDSTHVLGKVAALSRLELLWETLRTTLKALEKAAPAWYKKALPATVHEAYSERRHDWRLNEKEVQQETKKAGQDGYWLLDQLQASAPKHVRTLAEVETLRQVLEQVFTRSEEGDGSGGNKLQLRSPKRGQGKETIVNPHDPEARWSEKRGKHWRGYKLQVTETAEPEDGCTFLTDIRIVGASTHDSEVVTQIQDQLIGAGRAPETMVVDQGYVSCANLAESLARGITLLGPLPADTSGKPEGYRQEDFTLDWENETATCPQGVVTHVWAAREKDNRPGIYIRFGAACHSCDAWGKCTTGKRGRTLFVSMYHDLIAQRRAEQQTADFQEAMKARAAVEGTISMLVRSHGARQARYRGREKVNLQALCTGAAVNLKQVMRARRNRPRMDRLARVGQ